VVVDLFHFLEAGVVFELLTSIGVFVELIHSLLFKHTNWEVLVGVTILALEPNQWTVVSEMMLKFLEAKLINMSTEALE
jgi:hypothetical protein